MWGLNFRWNLCYLLSNTFWAHSRMERAHLLNQKQLKVFSLRSVILEPPIGHFITMCQTCLPHFVIAEYTLCVCVCYGRRLKLRNVTLTPGDSNTIEKHGQSHCPTHGVIVFCVIGISLGTFIVRFLKMIQNHVVAPMGFPEGNMWMLLARFYHTAFSVQERLNDRGWQF